ncbi:MAG: Metal dependent phosphohydrolase [Candidatus Wolfebacteria bacterium GW2011_GWC2_39_22]|uniref:Metal dependent phosphohydrolase n=2 Tax=Candidatus Wolfeibacteriota TaxID=1752735 RepID=A0A0G1JI86_9BACT|nr:MAG: Metal dependent phosphohydrolase [Candidatus Wolfebacteria bacterium GW2011_GWC2_39_22]KKT43687.1 MAG: Metal dependent phosphohydrolase [Candidatus Wolfebacteria bacterium GW2011_GWE2_44_13]HBI25583.1 hydrolase [Candidatus Wolfebacteria bacterium]
MEQLGLSYQQAQDLVGVYNTDAGTRLHARESEIIMRAIAKRLGEDEEAWGIIGLLHDIDWDLTKENAQEHCIKAQDILREAGASEFLITTIISHGYGLAVIPQLRDRQRTTTIEHCLVAAETLTGLIVASALMQPDKKLSNVSIDSLKKKFKKKGFAARCNRDLIMECEQANIPIDEFLQLGLAALQDIAPELGL